MTMLQAIKDLFDREGIGHAVCEHSEPQLRKLAGRLEGAGADPTTLTLARELTEKGIAYRIEAASSERRGR